MKLSEFLEETGMPRSTLAKRAGVSNMTITNLFRGRDIASTSLLRISRATRDRVSPFEIVEEYIEKKHKP
jgi:predicted transcriptional regulator